jgi:hypothetical protein
VTGEFGFDAWIDYKAESFKADLRAATANGVDIVFENVGGMTLDVALSRMNAFGVSRSWTEQRSQGRISKGPRSACRSELPLQTSAPTQLWVGTSNNECVSSRPCPKTFVGNLKVAVEPVNWTSW